MLLLRRGDAGANALLPELERHPDYGGGWLAVGEALLERGQPAAARTAIARGLRGVTALSPAQAARAHHLHGQALAADREPEAALQAFEAATGADPAYAQGWYSLALALQDQGRHQDAVAAYRAALTARPAFHEAALNLGVALGECGQLEAALDAYGHALAVLPSLFGRIAQALSSGRTGLVMLDPARLRARLQGRARPF